MNKTLIIISTIVASLALAACTPKTVTKTQTDTPASPKIETQIPAEVLKDAVNLYAKQKAEGTDFSKGPCLGKIADDWVLDIAHNPRQTIDDKPQNQCVDFRNGKAKHFIELDPEGKMIRAK